MDQFLAVIIRSDLELLVDSRRVAGQRVDHEEDRLPVSVITHRAHSAQVLAYGQWADCLGRDFSRTKLSGAGIPLPAYATSRVLPSVSGRVRLEHPGWPRPYKQHTSRRAVPNWRRRT